MWFIAVPLILLVLLVGWLAWAMANEEMPWPSDD